LTRLEPHAFNLFRLFQAALIAGLIFSPLALNWVALTHELLGRTVAIGYLAFAVLNMFVGTRSATDLRLNVSIALAADVAATTIALFAIRNPPSGIAMLLMVNVGAGALLLPPRMAAFFAALATLGGIGQSFLGRLIESQDRDLIEYGLYGFGYFATAALCFALGKQLRETEALAERRGTDIVNLAQINELIIRRMNTGVLVVDDANRVHLWYESAWALLGSPKSTHSDLGAVAPELSRRLYHWRTTRKLDNTSVALAEDVPEVIPRFTQLASHDDSNVLIFLDDTSLLSRRAEQLTLTSLGRLSASIAHEIRNPLAAISYSAQLLAESEAMPD